MRELTTYAEKESLSETFGNDPAYSLKEIRNTMRSNPETLCKDLWTTMYPGENLTCSNRR